MAGRSVVYCLPNENRRFSQREAEALELNLTQKQVQTLSPQMMQSMEILQMGSQELLEYIEEAVQENPVLEPEETYDKQDEFSVLRRKLEWLESTDPQNRYYHQQDTEEEDSPLNNFGTVQDDDENLYYYVLSQLRVLELEPEVMDAGVFLVESLNQNGWLDEPLEALAAGHGCGPEVMAQALEVVQSLEPAGVGARDLAECLKLQLVRRTPVNELAVRIVERHLDALSKSRYGLIDRELKASPEEVRAAGDEAASPDAAKALLKKLIAGEDKKKPLSDQKLCELMSAQGCSLSRRTVAKYRDELHIPSTAGRKQYETSGAF